MIQQGDQLTIRGLPGKWTSDLPLTLTVDGTVATGTWVEATEKDGYYRGARYHGAIQLIIDPTGRKMAGKWVSEQVERRQIRRSEVGFPLHPAFT